MMKKILKIGGVVVLAVWIAMMGVRLFTNETHYTFQGALLCPWSFSKPFSAGMYQLDRPFDQGEGAISPAISCSFSPYYFIAGDVFLILLVAWCGLGFWLLIVSSYKKFVEKRVLWQRSLFWFLVIWWFLSAGLVVGWVLYLVLTRL